MQGQARKWKGKNEEWARGMRWGWDDPPLNKPPRVKMRLDQEGGTKLRVAEGFQDMARQCEEMGTAEESRMVVGVCN